MGEVSAQAPGCVFMVRPAKFGFNPETGVRIMCMVNDVWCLQHFLHCLVHGAWFMVHCLVHGVNYWPGG